MKKIRIFCLGIIALFGTASCSDSSPDIEDAPDLGLKTEYAIPRLQVLDIEPQNVAANSGFEWTIKSKTTQEDSLIITDKTLSFISLYSGIYSVILKIKTPNETIEKQIHITVQKEAVPYSAYISRVYDFFPAVGQFTNSLPKWEDGDTQETMTAKAGEAIAGAQPTNISLGGYGGYVVFGFDHTIINITGQRDFKILGNTVWDATFDPSEKIGSSEPGIIMISYDKNKNGLPDDEWYEIAGSEYGKAETVKQYEIVYYKPPSNKTQVAGTEYWQTDLEYIHWEDNSGNSGYKTKNSWHSQSYYPEWKSSESLSFTGTKLADNYYQSGTKWLGKAYAYGYADNVPNDDEAAGIDIDWAVDKNGNKVKLAGIDFVKVYTGVNQENGWLGEISTEVGGGFDMHLKK
ncbi:MAG: cell surface protein [Flavobacteriaceae bacterium]|jgi:hypothetical protein|nr:cell surface protein [Flavobacteriaceae bacterium]